MDREDIRQEARIRSLIESTQISDTTLNSWINEGVLDVGTRYPFPGLSIVVLAADNEEPVWNSGFHDMLVDYVLWKMYQREEFFEEAETSRQRYVARVMEMARFYIGGRT